MTNRHLDLEAVEERDPGGARRPQTSETPRDLARLAVEQRDPGATARPLVTTFDPSTETTRWSASLVGGLFIARLASGRPRSAPSLRPPH